MGRLIDADILKEIFSRNVVGGNAFFDLIDNAPTVEAIPKAEYEARLKADMVAMLEELKEQLREMHEDYFETEHYDEAYGVSVSMAEIQQKIDKLREVEE